MGLLCWLEWLNLTMKWKHSYGVVVGRGRRSSGEFLVSPCPTEMMNKCAVTSPRQHRQGLRLLTPLGKQPQPAEILATVYS